MMRHLLLALGISCLWSCSPKDLPTVLDITDTEIRLKVSHMTTSDELADAIEVLERDHAILLQLSGTTYLDDGHLRDLECTVTTSNGSGGRTRATLSKLQYTYYGFMAQKGKSGWQIVKVGAI